MHGYKVNWFNQALYGWALALGMIAALLFGTGCGELRSLMQGAGDGHDMDPSDYRKKFHR